MWAIAAGCGPARLSGQIDGDPVGGARDAYFDTIEISIPFLGSFDYQVIVLTDFPDGCETVSDVSDAYDFGCDEICDELVPVAEEHGLREDEYWTTTLVANVSDGVDGMFDYDQELNEAEFTASFSTWDTRAIHDQAACEEACLDGDLLAATGEDGEDGELELELSDDGEVLAGRFDVDFGGDDQLSGRFNATACDTRDTWFIDL